MDYFKIKEARGIIETLKERRQTFELTETKYSKKIIVYPTLTKVPTKEDIKERGIKKLPKIQMMFNGDGMQDIILLGLINKVRNDASKWLGETGKEYINFFSLIDKPKYGTIAQKVDIKSAYWTCALKKDIIKQSTNQYLAEKMSNRPLKEVKHSRLKALGSLATIKKVTQYNLGKETDEDPDIRIQPTREIYMDVCRGVDQIMKHAALIPGVFYYYWDCIFCHREALKEVIEYIKDIGYNCSIDETVVEYVKVGENGYIQTTTDKKIYMVRKEDMHLLNNSEKYDYIDWKSDIAQLKL
jgi:hypothetical protein